MTQNKEFTPPTTIGFIGLGNMGFPMAQRLIKAGYSLEVADLNAEVLDTFCEATGAKKCTQLSSLGASCDVIITMLPEGKAVRQVLMSDGGVVEGLQAGSVLLDMSSCSPVGTRELANELADLGYAMVDAPVSGGVYKAADGSLAIMAGGETDVVKRCLPILETLGKVFETGGPASGHAMKAMNNFLSAATLAISSEAVILGTKFGLDPHKMIEVLNASTGRSNSTEHKFPAFILPRTFDSGFFIGLMAKDLRLALELANSEQTPSELLRLITNMWDKAEAQLGFNADNTEVVKYLESQVESHH